jgi:outer membrane protein OmpA-like peptidoglycan-associated protein
MYRQAKGGDIYVTEKDPATGAWKEPQKFANINTPDFEADAFITADGKTAYFATNHYKKIGDLDIYYVTKNEDGSWSKPQELQGRINTSEDEDAPFLTPDGKTLYFSSRGHKNMGGFDVFKSTLDSNGNWTNPVNVGYPINTPDDDVYYYMSSNGKKGYLSSYREGGYGEKDIYEIAPVPPAVIVCKIVPPCEGKQRELLSYKIQSLKKTTKPVSLSGKVDNDQLVANIYAFNSYRLAIYNSKDTLYSETIDVPFTENQNTRIEKEVSLSCPEGEKKPDSLIAAEEIKEESAIAHKYIFRNIVFEHGKTDLTAEGSREVSIASEILKKNPNAEIRILGSSDADEEKSLASKRSKKIHQELKSNGVKNVMKDTTAHSKNESIDSRSVVLEVKLKEPLKTNFDSKAIPKESVGDSYILRSIYFESAKSDLNEEAKSELDILVQLLNRHPELKLEIAGFTDSKGSNDINQALSEKRAQAALEYLLNKGIVKDRLEVKGYGKVNPISTNASEKGRRLNRRVDFKIKK